VVEITTLLWDVGGVVLTDGWDQVIRRQAAERFDLDVEDFQKRHEQAEINFETGRLSLEQYLYHTVFYRPRPFTMNQFKDYMIAQSHPQLQIFGSRSKYSSSSLVPPSPSPTCFSDSMNSIRSIHLTILYPS
jgi:hypothetical protein